MDFQAMYENIQGQIKLKVDAIASKKQEIAVMEAEINKLQGASEMLVVISNQMAKEESEELQESEVKQEEVKVEKPKRTTKK